MKKFNKKNIGTAAIVFLGFEGGKRTSKVASGVIENLVPNVDPRLIKGGIALASLFGAAIYNGKGKNAIVPALFGMATEQGGQLIDEGLSQVIPADANQLVKDFAGLNGLGCGCTNYTPPFNPNADYPMNTLNSPSVEGILPMDYNYQEEVFEFTGI